MALKILSTIPEDKQKEIASLSEQRQDYKVTQELLEEFRARLVCQIFGTTSFTAGPS